MTATTRSWARRLDRARREDRPQPREERRDCRRARSSPPRATIVWTTSRTRCRRCAGSEARPSRSGVRSLRLRRAGDAAAQTSSRRRRAARRRPRARPHSRTGSCSRRPRRARRARRRGAGAAVATRRRAASAFGRLRSTGWRGPTGASARSRRPRRVPSASLPPRAFRVLLPRTRDGRGRRARPATRAKRTSLRGRGGGTRTLRPSPASVPGARRPRPRRRGFAHRDAKPTTARGARIPPSPRPDPRPGASPGRTRPGGGPWSSTT